MGSKITHMLLLLERITVGRWIGHFDTCELGRELHRSEYLGQSIRIFLTGRNRAISEPR